MPRKGKVIEELMVNRPIMENVEVERPVSTRAKWDIDEDVLKVMATAETGKARRLHMSESTFLHKIHMAMRHALKGKSLSLHYKKIDERTLVAWAEKANKLTKALVVAWTLYALNLDGSLGRPLAQFDDKDSCIVASYRTSLLTGYETRCGQRGI
jgi:hypothetical protein